MRWSMTHVHVDPGRGASISNLCSVMRDELAKFSPKFHHLYVAAGAGASHIIPRDTTHPATSTPFYPTFTQITRIHSSRHHDLA